MKIIPPPCPEPEVGPKYWRSLDHLSNTPEIRQWIDQEFPVGASLAPEGEMRRDWLKLMSASFLFAGLGGIGAGCRRPEEHLTPFAKQPEGYIHGKAEHYATSMPTRGSAVPLVVKSTDGRPVKIEGNSLHPAGNGGTDQFAQASILEVYDPDRAFRHAREGNSVKIEAVKDFLSSTAARFGATQGEGLSFLAGRSSSPSRLRLRKALLAKLPKATWHEYEAVDFAVHSEAASRAFGAEVIPHVHLEKARRILSLDCDFIGAEADAYHHIRGYAKGRKGADREMNRLYAVEGLFTLTGAQADHRLRVKPSDVVKVAAHVASFLVTTGDLSNTIKSLAAGSPADAKWAEECAKDLAANRGASVVVAGYTQPEAVHLIAYAINQAVGAVGTTLDLLPHPEAGMMPLGLRALVDSLNAGRTDTLVIFGGNPAFNAPADLNFSVAAKKAKTVVRLGYYEDETAALATWHLTEAHFLESWGDSRTVDGTVTPVQPLIEPLFGGLTEIEVLSRLLGENKSPLEIVRETAPTVGVDGEGAWKKLLHDGFAAGTAFKPVGVTFNASNVQTVLRGVTVAPANGFDVVLFRDASVDDGRHANNGWLQELADPITKITWDNVVMVSMKTARELGVSYSNPDAERKSGASRAHDGQYKQTIVKVTVGNVSVEGPVWIQPGLADGTVGIALGYGRSAVGRVGSKVGFNAYPLFQSSNRHLIRGAAISTVVRRKMLAVTQEHGLMEGRPVVREANLEQFLASDESRKFAKNMDLDSHLPHYVPYKDKPDGRNPGRVQNIYEHPYDANPKKKSEIHQWGMVVDLASCVGCSACVIACQSENNIPIVGKDQVARGREMAWIRIDRYYSSDPEVAVTAEQAAVDPQAVVQPMFCQHCEAAPCESVCPVNATVHDEEGLNVMAYNRCIGTRYCANNCPFKVRRFNFFDFNKRETDWGGAQDQHFLNLGNLYKGPAGVNRNEAPEWEIIKLVKNPDVSVRMRGVMEKCTFCVQRIEQAKIARKVEVKGSGDVAVPDGTIKTACQQACPAEAITFGNMQDPNSAVMKLKADPRNYTVLGFLDIRPRVTYLARIRNPNPALAAIERRETPDTMRDYERHRHENPFKAQAAGGKPI